MLDATVCTEDHALVDRLRGWPFTLPARVPPLRLDRDAVEALGHGPALRRWAARWGGAYNARTGELSGCFGLGLDPEDWLTLSH